MNPGVSLWLVLSLLVTSQAANNPEVSWGDWLVVDEAEPGTSILLRRITPKSVFVAPSLNSCSEGYQQDALGRCVKIVKVNQKAQWNFFLERINSMYAPSSTSKQPQKETGPFHISLPIGSDSSQEEGIVRKRVPPIIRDDIIRKPIVRVQTTPFPPTTTTLETTTLDVTSPTMIDCSEITTTENQPEITTESRRIATTTGFFDAGLVFGDQPSGVEDVTEIRKLDTPKIHKENSSQLPEKPFVIIVTNPPSSRFEETTSYSPLTTTEEESETPTEFSTEGTTETTTRFMTEVPSRTTEYDGSVSESKDTVETSIRPSVMNNFAYTVRPKCDPTVHILDYSDCDPNTEIISDFRKVPNSEVPAPTILPRLETKTPIRFPSELIAPVHKPQSYVRFPEVTNPHDDRPSFWWPTWQVRQHPGIGGWPPSDTPSSEQALRQQYPPYTYTWSDSSAWRRRFFQRD